MPDQYLDLQIPSANEVIDPAELAAAIADHGLSDRPYEVVTESKTSFGFHLKLRFAGDDELVVKIGREETVGAGDTASEAILDVDKFNMYNQPGYFGAMVLGKLILNDEASKTNEFVILWKDLRKPGAKLRWGTDKVPDGEEPFSNMKDLDNATPYDSQEFEKFCWSLPIRSDEQEQLNRVEFIKHAEVSSNA
jgi:hypothetical protein